MSATIHRQTPTLQVFESRGATVCAVQYWRSLPQQPAQTMRTRRVYDAVGRAVAEWDPRLAGEPANLERVYSLSEMPLSTTSVDAGWRVNLFDDSGKSLHAWDGRGSERQTEYDELSRPVAIFEQTLNSPPGCTQRYTYGPATPVFADHNQCGQLIRLDDLAGTRKLKEYGVSGGLLEQEQYFLQNLDPPDWPLSVSDRDTLLESGPGAKTVFCFNPMGDLLTQIDAQENRQIFNQTVDGQLRDAWLHLKNAATPHVLVRNLRYNAQGQIEQQTAGNNVLSLRDYCPKDGRLTRLRAIQPGGEPLQDLNYLYDPVGDILSLEDKALPIRFFANQRIEPINRYSYDSLYQLIEATGREAGSANRGPAHVEDPAAVANYRQTYRYDAGGNLLELIHHGPQQHGRVLTAARFSNRCLPEVDGKPPTEEEIAAGFDANGNLLVLDRGKMLGWDARNQLSHVHRVKRTLGLNDSEHYAYGADGMRQRKVCSAQTNTRTVLSETRYLPAGLEVRRVDGETLHVITAQAGRETVQVLHWETPVPGQLANDQYRYNLSDYLGSCSLELDSEARVISRETYHPFGSTAFTERGDSSEESYRTLRYSGKERDATGLYYYGLRYYAPWLNRWINPDPAGDIDGLNFFRFVRNNPSTLIDREGLVPQVPEKVEEDEFMEVSEGLVTRMEGIAKSENKQMKSAEADLKKINNSGKKNLQKEAVQSDKARLEKLIKDSSEKEKKANQAAIMFGEYARSGDKYVLKNDELHSVGVMSLTHDVQSNAKKIETIATDIEKSGNGAILIAHAVNESERAGLEGVVTLIDVSAGSGSVGDPSKNIYSYFGFETIDDEPGKMKLVPSHSALWKKSGGTWERVRKQRP